MVIKLRRTSALKRMHLQQSCPSVRGHQAGGIVSEGSRGCKSRRRLWAILSARCTHRLARLHAIRPRVQCATPGPLEVQVRTCEHSGCCNPERLQVWNFMRTCRGPAPPSAFPPGSIPPAASVGSYKSHRDEKVVSKSFIVLLNCFCFLMVTIQLI